MTDKIKIITHMFQFRGEIGSVDIINKRIMCPKNQTANKYIGET